MFDLSTALRRFMLLAAFVWGCIVVASGEAEAQVCPSPVSVSGTGCVVTSGSTITVNAAAVPGLNAQNSGGLITGSGLSIRLGPGAAPQSFIGARALSGAAIELSTTTITTIQSGASQRGLLSDGAGSHITGTGLTMTLGLGTTITDNLAVLAQNGGLIQLTGSFIATNGGGNGSANHAVTASGTNSRVELNGGSVTTAARGSFGVQAVGGATVTINGTSVGTTGLNVVATSTGSHALLANGTGSRIDGTNLTLTTSGLLASGARAQNGAAINLTGGSINTGSTSQLDTDPAAAVRALSGGQIHVDGTTITTTGQRGAGLSVEDAGSLVDIRNASVDISGTRANAALIQNGGQALIANSSLWSRNTTSIAVQGSGSSVAINNSAVRSSGPVGYGVKVTAGGTATISGGTVLTENRDSPPLYVANGSATANNVTFTSTGIDNSMGVLADINSTVVLNGGAVSTSGNPVRAGTYANGIAARNPGGSLTANGTSITTSGTLGFGVVADDGGAVTLDGNTIRTSGNSASGLFSTVEQGGTEFVATITGQNLSVDTLGTLAHGAIASQHFHVAQSLIDLKNSTLATHGAGSDGLRAIGSGTVNSDASAVQTDGVGSMGMHARDNGSSVNIVNTSVVTSGTNAHGALANAGGTISGTGSTVSAAGSNAHALYVAGATGFVSSATFDDSRLSNVSGASIAVGGIGRVTLTNSVVSGSSEWLRVGQISDFAPLAAPDSGPGGILDPEGVELPTAFPPPAALPVEPGLADVTLDGSTVTGTAFTAPGSTSNLVMLNDSRWFMTGSSNLTSIFNDPSLIQFSPPAGDPTLLSSYMTLTTVSYIGDGGNIGLNTYLDTDGSPSDRLVIDGGSATGTSGLIIDNTTGAGALTTANGILVIDAINGGVTDTGAFTLAAPAVAGPYEYRLFRGSTDASGPDNWYLRSFLQGPDLPIYRPEVSLYSTMPSMATLYGRNLLDTLHERVGEEEQLKGRTDIGEDENFNGVWLRGIGQWGRQEGSSNGIYGGIAEFDYRYGALQGGMDLYREEKDDITDHAGIYLAYGRGRMDVTHRYPEDETDAGHNDMNAFSLGGYWTRFGENGWYLDGVLQGTWYDFETHSDRNTAIGFPSQDVDGFGIAASLEGGYPFDLGNGWQLEPQAQIIWQHIDLDSFNDGAADIRFDDVNALTGRIGARLARTWEAEEATETEPAQLATVWGRINLWHEFTAKAKTEVSSADGFVPFASDLDDTWIEFGLGASRQISAKTTLYGNVNFSTSFDSDNYAVEGKAGFRINW